MHLLSEMSLKFPFLVYMLSLVNGNTWNDLERNALESCPCSSSWMCFPVPITQVHEVFAFSPNSNTSNWRYYNYDIVTTIAWNTNKELLCHAHARMYIVICLFLRLLVVTRGVDQVKIVVQHNFDKPALLCNAEERKRWIELTYELIVKNFADGVNIDTEEGMHGKDAICQTLLLKELRQRLQQSAWTKRAQVRIAN